MGMYCLAFEAIEGRIVFNHLPMQLHLKILIGRNDAGPPIVLHITFV